jgi:hypothetical protein
LSSEDSIVLIGILIDRFGIWSVAVPAVILLTTETYALYLGAKRTPWALLPLYVLAESGAGVTTLIPVVMVRAFPPVVRFTGVALSYNVAYALFGGITPVLVSVLAHITPLGPAHFLTVAAAVSLIAIVLTSTTFDSTRETVKTKLQGESERKSAP